ncbi:heme oxygenase [Alkalihalobacillus pseudalcaliphilus]|uniref:heme oxygenase n=1 Tax=Alkalihalobacillus pseudalcaliphilus TaxID=79884 RepID=UPI00064DDBEF|nr:heme oxygenase [Alkalihalobacillus pseudalcaliphilus]KMK76105.1 heme-degrading monooxygenase IsdG [Alkalihalobacillus pseudalcaliphilus]
MYIVTNRIKMKKGFAEKLAPNFTKPGPLQDMKGFIKVETTIRENIEEHDELSVNMYWEELTDFEAWKTSDAFKQAHAKPKSDEKKEKSDSPMLSSEVIIVKVATTIEANS